MYRYSRSEPLIISAGFPCQDASSNNFRGKGLEGGRTGLFYEALRLINEVRPEYVVLENVANLVHRGLPSVTNSLSECGYTVWYRIISAASLGFCFEGKRIFIVAFEPSLSVGLEESHFFDSLYESEFRKKRESLHLEHPCAGVRRETYAELIEADNGLSSKLAASELKAYGNAVQPDMAEIVFNTIQTFHKHLFPWPQKP